MIRLALFISLLAGPAPVAPAAEPATPHGVEWNAPQTCGDAASIRADVARLLGGEEADLTEVSANGTVTRETDERWQLELRVATADGETTRSLVGESCETLAEAAALYIALAVDPMAVLEADVAATSVEAAEPEPEPEPEPQPESEPEPTPEPTPEPKPAPKQLQLGLRLLGAGGIGLRTSVYGGGGLGIGIVARRVRVDATGFYQFATVSNVGLPEDASARVQHGYAEVRGCPIFGGPRVTFIGCGGVLLGGFEARGLGLPDTTTARSLWLGLGVTAGIQLWVIPRLAISLEPSALFSLIRPRFAIDGAGEVFRVGVVGGRLALGLEVLAF